MSNDAVSQEIRQADENRYNPRKKFFFAVLIFLAALFVTVALIIGHFGSRYATLSILDQQRELEQTLLDKNLDGIRVWRAELAEQAHFISSSEMFRLFIMDSKSLSREDLQKLADPETLHDPDEGLRSMAENYTYIQDLLRDFIKRRAWNDARILLEDGSQLVEPQFSTPLTAEQTELARHAAEGTRAIFGPIRQGEEGLVMDMADPLFDVLGAGSEPTVVGVLLLSVPMDKPLASFLGRGTLQDEALYPRIVFPAGDALAMALPRDGEVRLEKVTDLKRIEPLPFGHREGLAGQEEVYSIGGTPTGLNWLFVLEKPAIIIDDVISLQKKQIYGLGLVSALGVTLLLAWLMYTYRSRRYEADAMRYASLCKTINNQKMMLDSINASFTAGMALIDQYGRVLMSNPAFCAICGLPAIKPATPLLDTLPGDIAVKVIEDVNRVNLDGKSDSAEINMDRNGDRQIYRVTYYPYKDEEDKSGDSSGCVVILQDITRFRREAEIRRKQQEDLITALVRAVESVDPNLVGHSNKMAGIAGLLAKKLKMDENQEKTLSLAAKLSQVGKIDVPRELWTKTGKLTEEEMKEISRIPEHADRILGDLDFNLPVRETVGMISERVDGSGKPRGLLGDEITLPGKALAVVDAFIAMTSPRAWRKHPMSPQEAISQLASNAGFDQGVVAALAELDAEALAKIVRGGNA